MIPLSPPFRVAAPKDAAVLAQFVNDAGHGLPLHLWNGMAQPGEDPWDIGRARQADKVAAGQIVVVDQGDGAIAGLTGYVIGPEPEEIAEDFPPIFRPLQELENAALNSWYVNVLACLPGHRGSGLGTALLDLAEDIARAENLKLMSLIVSDDNPDAARLYVRRGYAETARRPCVKGDWQTSTEAWILMTKPLS